jgi:DHA1 family bicyclomycin/chloramphenicol resistance-like MFS transporter
VLGLLLLALFQKETRPPAARLESSIGSAINGYKILLRDWNFLGLSFIGGFGMSSFMAYLGNSSFILIEHYGLTPTFYSFMFSINAVAFIGVSQLAGVLGRRYGLGAVVKAAVTAFTIVMVTLFVIFAAGVDSLAIMGCLLFVGYGALGLVIPTTTVLAMEGHGEIAGTSSALLGTIQLLTAAVVMGISGVFFNGTALPMVAVIAACAVIAFALTQATIRRSPAVAAPAAAE